MSKYQTFWPRVGAILIDAIILSIFFWILRLFGADQLQQIYVLRLFFSYCPELYAIIMLGRYGQTLGKMVTEVKVVDNETEQPITYYQAFLREGFVPLLLLVASAATSAIVRSDLDDRDLLNLSTFTYVILAIPSFLALIWSVLEIVTMLFDDKNRALHDKIAGTVVIRKHPARI